MQRFFSLNQVFFLNLSKEKSHDALIYIFLISKSCFSAVTCEQSSANIWETAPWNFGGQGKGRLWGDGLVYKGCIKV